MRTLALAFFSMLAWVGISASTLLWTLSMAPVYLLRRWVDPRMERLHWMAAHWGRMLIQLAPGSHLALTGLRNVPKGRPVIFMSNHQSYCDVPALFCLPAQFKWLADADLFRIPVFGWAMRMAGYIPVRRGNAQEGLLSLAEANRYLMEGISIFVFPEGTRSHTGVLGRFQTGGFRLAAQAQVPIVPVVISGTRQMLPRGSWIFRPGVRVELEILPAVAPPRDVGSIRAVAHRVRGEMARAYRRNLRAVLG